MFYKSMSASLLAIILVACSGGDTPSTETNVNKAEAPASSGRNQIKIVGSSTVYPFATTVAENFGRTTKFKTPVVESTGSGGGLKLFCAGVGANHPEPKMILMILSKSKSAMTALF